MCGACRAAGRTGTRFGGHPRRGHHQEAPTTRRADEVCGCDDGRIGPRRILVGVDRRQHVHIGVGTEPVREPRRVMVQRQQPQRVDLLRRASRVFRGTSPQEPRKSGTGTAGEVVANEIEHADDCGVDHLVTAASARCNEHVDVGQPVGVQRAAVLIGVSRTGGLPPLRAVTPGIDQMTAWTTAQGFSTITTITDAERPVTVGQIQQAIGAVLYPGTLDQLVVYFAGHGVNIGRAEYWLLSGAPRWASEAVNVDASERLAQYCGVGHVVFISDCCRTAAAAETALQSISGTTIFPNDPPGPARRPVDRFYGCALGSPALEVRPEGADGYTAVYTATLVEALGGRPDSLLERTDDGTRGSG